MVRSTGKKPRKKRPGRYHHGDLRQALLDQALRHIETEGVETLTVRGVGAKLGVSRSALYRHFSDKQALLAAVAREGFRAFRLALSDAWERNGRGIAGFEAQGAAYLQFARGHPAHYRVMFGRFIESCRKDPEVVKEAAGAFQVLVDALLELQGRGLASGEDPQMLALCIWAQVHGLSMLAIDGQLRGAHASIDALNRYAVQRIVDLLQCDVSVNRQAPGAIPSSVTPP
jgi:AcrR family transcriptional regulator